MKPGRPKRIIKDYLSDKIIKELDNKIESLLKQYNLSFSIEYSAKYSFTIKDLEKTIYKVFGGDYNDLIYPCRKVQYTIPRKIFSWYCWNYLNYNEYQISEMLKNDRTTTLHYVKYR